MTKSSSSGACANTSTNEGSPVRLLSVSQAWWNSTGSSARGVRLNSVSLLATSSGGDVVVPNTEIVRLAGRPDVAPLLVAPVHGEHFARDELAGGRRQVHDCVRHVEDVADALHRVRVLE